MLAGSGPPKRRKIGIFCYAFGLYRARSDGKVSAIWRHHDTAGI